MSSRPARTRLRRVLPLAAAAAVGVAAGAGAYALTNKHSDDSAAPNKVVVPAQAASSTSTVDSLTGIFNRAFFFAALEREIQRSARSGRGFCLLMMDLDGLKAINDKHGHFHGDEALRAVGETIRAGVRRIDTAARYGGDEFVVLLPETSKDQAMECAKRLRSEISKWKFLAEEPYGPLQITASLGVAAAPVCAGARDTLIEAADAAMYAAKRAGKNRTYSAPVLTTPPAPALRFQALRSSV